MRLVEVLLQLRSYVLWFYDETEKDKICWRCIFNSALKNILQHLRQLKMYISFITFILLFVVCIYVHYFFDVVRKPTQQQLLELEGVYVSIFTPAWVHFGFRRIIARKNHHGIKLQRLEKVRMWIFRSLVHWIDLLKGK